MIHSKQREFKVTRIETEHVSATSYHEGRVAVKFAGSIVTLDIRHEDNIPPEWKTSAPELYEFVRKELCSNRPLADNELRSSRGDIVQLRWHNGERQRRWMSGTHSHDGWGAFHNIVLGEDNQLKAEAWFRANCPIDRFVTDSGDVLVFRMRDDGEAETSDGQWITISGGPYLKVPSILALYRFRDAERAKWTFELDAHGVSVLYDGQYGFGGYYPGEGTSRRIEAQPAWVRARAKSVFDKSVFEEANPPVAPATRIQFDAYVVESCKITGKSESTFALVGEHSERVELKGERGRLTDVLQAARDRRRFRVTVEVVPEGEGS